MPFGFMFTGPTAGDIVTDVTAAMLQVVPAATIAVIAIAAISLTLAWSGLRRVLRIGGR